MPKFPRKPIKLGYVQTAKGKKVLCWVIKGSDVNCVRCQGRICIHDDVCSKTRGGFICQTCEPLFIIKGPEQGRQMGRCEFGCYLGPDRYVRPIFRSYA